MKLVGHGLRVKDCDLSYFSGVERLKNECSLDCAYCKKECLIVKNGKIYLDQMEIAKLDNIYSSNIVNIIPYVLRRNNSEIVIHGSACVINGNAICVIGASGTGKRSVIDFFIKNYNASYLCDDIIRIGKHGILPCYSQPDLLRSGNDTYIIPIDSYRVCTSQNDVHIKKLYFITNDGYDEIKCLTYAESLFYLSLNCWGFYSVKDLHQKVHLDKCNSYYISGDLNYKINGILSTMNIE